MQIKLFALIFIITLYSFHLNNNYTPYRMPAEWEPQQAVWVGMFFSERRDTASAEIIKAIYNNVQVRLNYSSDYNKKAGNLFLQSFEIDTTKLEWIKDSLANIWVRDTGPLFLLNKKREQKVIDFNWIEYGHHLVNKTQLSLSDHMRGRADIRMAAKLNLPVISTSFVAEGGGIETNGAGVLMSIEETALQRNPGKTLKEIEIAYLQVTGCKKLIWLKQMMLHDKTVPGLLVENWASVGANGHIDEAVRFVGTNTIAVAKIDEEERNSNPISKIDYDILEEYCETLKKATDVNGKPFNVIRMPSPDLNVHSVPYILNENMRKYFKEDIPEYKDGDTIKFVPAVSYLNFMVTNGVVLVARYWKKGMPLKEKEKDAEAKKILQAIYPGRKVVQIYPMEINNLGGGIHCITQQQPK